MRIAINGIGVAGPTLAWWLRHYGHEPVLFERAPALRTGGYLIDFWGPGYEIAEQMGILPTVLARGYKYERMQMVDSTGRDEAVIDLRPLRDALHGRLVSLPRSELSAILFSACSGVRAEFGTAITGVSQRDDRVHVALSDGRKEEFDLVIGADGLHSAIRAAVFGPEADFERFLDCYVAAFSATGYLHRDDLTFVSHTLVQRQAARVSLRDDGTLFLFICRSELFEGEPAKGEEKAALRRALGDMGWEVPAMLDAMDRADDLYFDRVSQIQMPHWTSGRVALVGDAGACPSLLAGEGTGLGMTEAYVLAGELHRANGDYQAAYAAYERTLRDMISAKQKGAIWFRGFFAPQTTVGAAVRHLAVDAFTIPLIAKPLLARSLRDDFELPDYEAT